MSEEVRNTRDIEQIGLSSYTNWIRLDTTVMDILIIIQNPTISLHYYI